MAIERTLSIVKPDAVAKNVIGQIYSRFEEAGLRLVAARMMQLSRQQADQFVTITTKGAWVGIAALVIFWLTVRFIGPAAGWWTLADG